MAKMKILTGKELRSLWKKHRVHTFNQGNKGMLSTTGVRKLIFSCFPLEDADIWIKKANGYNGKPNYPFHQQPPFIQDMIVTMLDTNPMGKHFMDQLVEKLSGQLLLDALRGENHE